MKESKYNIYVKREHGAICFNTFHDLYSFMSAKLYELIQAEEYDRIRDEQKKILLTNGFLVEQDDELTILMKEHIKALSSNGTYELTLLPSLDCNLRLRESALRLLSEPFPPAPRFLPDEYDRQQSAFQEQLLQLLFGSDQMQKEQQPQEYHQ